MRATAYATHMRAMTTYADAFVHYIPGQSVRELILSGYPVFFSADAAAVAIPDGHEIAQVIMNFGAETRFLVQSPDGSSRFDELPEAMAAAHYRGLQAGQDIKGIVITNGTDSTTFRALPLSAFIVGYAPYRGTPIPLHASSCPE